METKASKTETMLLIGSVIVLIYFLFMQFAYANQWDNTVLVAIMEFITIPIILLGCIIPLIVVYRFISEKTSNKVFSGLTLLFSLIIAIMLAYTSF